MNMQFCELADIWAANDSKVSRLREIRRYMDLLEISSTLRNARRVYKVMQARLKE